MSKTPSFEEKSEQPSVNVQAVDQLETAGPQTTNDRNLDVAGRFLAQIALEEDAEELLRPQTEDEEKAVVRQADRHVMPLLWASFMLASVDKVTIGTAAVFGLRTDLKLVGEQYSFVSSCIYFGAIAGLFPTIWLIQRLPAAKFFAGCVFMWGIILMSMAACTSFGGLMAARFFLGVFEAVQFSGAGLLMTMWWTSKEQGWRSAIIFSTCSSLVNGLMSFAVVHLPPNKHLTSWQLLFITIGIITLIDAVCLFIWLPDSPTTARWLTKRQRVVAVRRMQRNSTGIENKVFKMSQAKEALLDVKTWLYFIIQILINIPNGGLVTFNSVVVSSLGFNVKQTTLLAIPTGIISWIGALIFTPLAARLRLRSIVALFACLIPLTGTVLLTVLPRSNIGGSLAGLYILYGYWAPYVVFNSAMYVNTAGYSKKLVTFAISYIGYCVGCIVGPLTFKASEAPRYHSGSVAMLTCYCMAMLFMGIYALNIVRLNRNKKKQLETAALGEITLLDGLQDETDFQNPRMVYSI